MWSSATIVASPSSEGVQSRSMVCEALGNSIGSILTSTKRSTTELLDKFKPRGEFNSNVRAGDGMGVDVAKVSEAGLSNDSLYWPEVGTLDFCSG